MCSSECLHHPSAGKAAETGRTRQPAPSELQTGSRNEHSEIPTRGVEGVECSTLNYIFPCFSPGNADLLNIFGNGMSQQNRYRLSRWIQRKSEVFFTK